ESQEEDNGNTNPKEVGSPEPIEANDKASVKEVQAHQMPPEAARPVDRRGLRYARFRAKQEKDLEEVNDFPAMVKMLEDRAQNVIKKSKRWKALLEKINQGHRNFTQLLNLFRKAVKSSHMKKVHEVVSVLSGQKPHEHADEEEIAPHGRGHPKDELHEEPVVKTQEMTKEEEKLFEKNGAQEKPVSPMEEKPVSPTMEEKPESPPSETEEVSSPSPTASGEDDDEDEDEDNEASSAEGSQGTSEPPQPGMDENKQTSKEDTGSGTDSTADTADDTADSANAGIDCGARKGAAKGSALWCGCNVNAQPVGSQELCEHPGGGRIDVCQWSSESSSCVPKSEKS
ncbi:unnamed protein product, partial [Durusdinium trenchii]